MFRRFLPPLLFICLGCTASQAKTLYKWVDASGHITYQGHPPPTGSKSTQVIETDTRAIYKIVDSNGNITFQDRPADNPDSHKPPVPVLADATISQDKLNRISTTSGTLASPSQDSRFQMTWLSAQVLTTAFLVLIGAGLIRKFYGSRIKGCFGEKKVAAAISILGYPALHDVILPCGENDLTQIDHIVKTPSGILVIETKHYAGKILGKAGERLWTQCLAHGKTLTFQNPIRQNHKHVRAIKRLVTNMPVFSQVIFTGRAVIPEGIGPEVTTLRRFLKQGDIYQSKTVNDENLELAWSIIRANTKTDRPTRKAHLKTLKESHG